MAPHTHRTEPSEAVLWAEEGVVAAPKPMAGDTDEAAEEEPGLGYNQ